MCTLRTHHCRHSKNDEIEKLLNAEVQLREEHQQQLLLERQQWCLEKDALQKVLQEQQGTAHTVEQHLAVQITALQDQLAQQHSGQQTAARTHQDTLEALQNSHQQLQQQHGKLQQDLQAALAYRHKCLQQKQELQQLRNHTSGTQLRSMLDQGAAEEVSDDQQADATAVPPQEGVHAVNSPASSSEDLAALVGLSISVQQCLLSLCGAHMCFVCSQMTQASSHWHCQHVDMAHCCCSVTITVSLVVCQVVKLKGERELVKRAYLEEKKKADRYLDNFGQYISDRLHADLNSVSSAMT